MTRWKLNWVDRGSGNEAHIAYGRRQRRAVTDRLAGVAHEYV
jgi:hypothetical protein